MRKNNWFNRTFHSKEVEANQAEATKQTALYARREEILDWIKSASTFEQLLDLHKKVWNEGYQNANIAPCSYGMFRTKDIDLMKPEEVYLGGVWGLTTRNIPFWEARKEDKYGANGFGISPEVTLYDLIVGQYRNHLLSNIRAIAMNAKQMIDEYCDSGYEIFYQRSC